MLQAQTLNRKAFDFFNSATMKVANYYLTLDSRILDLAISDLDQSIKLDPQYFQPLNYKGIIYDIKGLPKKALEAFDEIQPSDLSGDLRLEVDYNKAVANYHLYHEPNIQAAITELTKLTQVPTGNLKLTALANAALAQSYGMMVLHSQQKGQTIRDQYVALADSTAENTIKFIYSNQKALGAQFVNNAIWIAYNAEGISLMYRDDHKRDAVQPEEEQYFSENLNKAAALFDQALTFSPNNWAVKCNVGSVNMRLGHLYIKLNDIAKAKTYFIKATAILTEVVEKVRINYDFAFYEMGRIERFQQNKTKALAYFEKAITAGGANKNVDEERINKNITLTEGNLITFIV
jgi:tetratricopeptide (TPR) repeat protein